MKAEQPQAQRGTTARRLVDAAERLFAERGIGAVSLREINREAGALNAMAVQYHFDDRDGLLRAILAKHLPAVEAQRHALLDVHEAAAVKQPRDLAAALVRPYASKLSDPDGGPAFLQVYAELVNGPVPLIEPGSLEDPGNSLYRWRNAVDPILDDDAVRLHRRFTAVSHTITELGRRARSRRGDDHRLFISYLIDNVHAILTAETSEETRAAMAAKKGSKPAVSG